MVNFAWTCVSVSSIRTPPPKKRKKKKEINLHEHIEDKFTPLIFLFVAVFFHRVLKIENYYSYHLNMWINEVTRGYIFIF